LGETKYEIIFTKKDILLNMIKIGIDFKNLYEFNYFEDLRFKKIISFKNIFDYHMELIKRIIKNNNRSISDFNFHLVSLVDVEEVNRLYNDLIDNILPKSKSKKEINVPNLIIKTPQNNFLNYFNNYDFNIYYYCIMLLDI
jgi:hypothetical protein